MITLILHLFFVMNALGNIAPVIAVLRPVTPQRRFWVLLREMGFALAFALVFALTTEGLFQFIQVQEHSLTIAGGIILGLSSLFILFPINTDMQGEENDPIFIPIATPMIAGPATLSAIALHAPHNPWWVMVIAVTTAWMAALFILIASLWSSKWLGDALLLALEKFMGLMLILLSITMIINGLTTAL